MCLSSTLKNDLRSSQLPEFRPFHLLEFVLVPRHASEFHRSEEIFRKATKRIKMESRNLFLHARTCSCKSFLSSRISLICSLSSAKKMKLPRFSQMSSHFVKKWRARAFQTKNTSPEKRQHLSMANQNSISAF